MLAIALACCFVPAGCSHGSYAAGTQAFTPPSKAAKESARTGMDAIPPPSKNLYLAVRNETSWQNPFISVESNMLQVRVYLPDLNSSQIDRGGLTRSMNARKQEFSIRLRNLPDALSAVPQGSWPYGRVVAVAEGYETKQDRAQIRRNMEATIQTLNDLGVVVDEWNQSGQPPLH
jgi:hypothetical protein